MPEPRPEPTQTFATRAPGLQTPPRSAPSRPAFNESRSLRGSIETRLSRLATVESRPLRTRPIARILPHSLPSPNAGNSCLSLETCSLDCADGGRIEDGCLDQDPARSGGRTRRQVFARESQRLGVQAAASPRRKSEAALNHGTLLSRDRRVALSRDKPADTARHVVGILRATDRTALAAPESTDEIGHETGTAVLGENREVLSTKLGERADDGHVHATFVAVNGSGGLGHIFVHAVHTDSQALQQSDP